MAHKRARRRSYKQQTKFFVTAVMCSALVMVGTGMTIIHYVLASSDQGDLTGVTVDPNFGVKNRVIEFFEANDAEEMIPVIKCESRFRHYEQDGTVLMNKSGSSATGVAQIMASVHPDPKVITRFNKAHNTDLTIADFDITTIEGNLGYALVLYEMNGTRDWECAHSFRW